MQIDNIGINGDDIIESRELEHQMDKYNEIYNTKKYKILYSGIGYALGIIGLVIILPMF